MKKLLIAFDVDGTLVSNDGQPGGMITPNERVCRMLIDLSHSKNVKILVWSGGGELWARQAVAALGLTSYVKQYADKIYIKCTKCTEPCNHHEFGTQIRPDIAFDDIQECVLADKNIIVREK